MKKSCINQQKSSGLFREQWTSGAPVEKARKEVIVGNFWGASRGRSIHHRVRLPSGPSADFLCTWTVLGNNLLEVETKTQIEIKDLTIAKLLSLRTWNKLKNFKHNLMCLLLTHLANSLRWIVKLCSWLQCLSVLGNSISFYDCSSKYGGKEVSKEIVNC